MDAEGRRDCGSASLTNCRASRRRHGTENVSTWRLIAEVGRSPVTFDPDQASRGNLVRDFRPKQQAFAMKRNLLLAAGLLGLFPFAVQSTPEKGDLEFQLSGVGSHDNDSDKTVFGASGSVGLFVTDFQKFGVRQRTRLDESERGGDLWRGETLGFYNVHFHLDPVQPFVGASLGYSYGERVNEAFIVAPEVGVNFYLPEKTFITFQVEYQVSLEDANQSEGASNDEKLVYTIGTGFNF